MFLNLLIFQNTSRFVNFLYIILTLLGNRPSNIGYILSLAIIHISNIFAMCRFDLLDLFFLLNQLLPVRNEFFIEERLTRDFSQGRVHLPIKPIETLHLTISLYLLKRVLSGEGSNDNVGLISIEYLVESCFLTLCRLPSRIS